MRRGKSLNPWGPLPELVPRKEARSSFQRVGCGGGGFDTDTQGQGHTSRHPPAPGLPDLTSPASDQPILAPAPGLTPSQPGPDPDLPGMAPDLPSLAPGSPGQPCLPRLATSNHPSPVTTAIEEGREGPAQHLVNSNLNGNKRKVTPTVSGEAAAPEVLANSPLTEAVASHDNSQAVLHGNNTQNNPQKEGQVPRHDLSRGMALLRNRTVRLSDGAAGRQGGERDSLRNANKRVGIPGGADLTGDKEKLLEHFLTEVMILYLPHL